MNEDEIKLERLETQIGLLAERIKQMTHVKTLLEEAHVKVKQQLLQGKKTCG